MTLIRRDVLPFLFWMVALVVVTIGVDLVLHQARFAVVGRYLGAAGLLLVVVSLLPYSLRKRGVIKSGEPATLLRAHQIGGWLGALLMTIHAGAHFNALLPWSAALLMLIDVAAGFGGAYLFHNERLHFDESKAALMARGVSPAEIEQRLFWDALTLDVTKKWRLAHAAMAGAFALLAFAHIVTIFMFWSWR